MSVIIQQNGFHLFHRQFVIVGDFFRRFAKFFALNERLRGNALRANGRPALKFLGVLLGIGVVAPEFGLAHICISPAILSRASAWPPREDREIASVKITGADAKQRYEKGGTRRRYEEGQAHHFSHRITVISPTRRRTF